MGVYKQFAKETFIYGLASVLPRVVMFLLVRLHTDVLPPAAYSVNTKFYVWIAFFNVLFTYGMETAFFRFFSQMDDKKRVLRTAFTSLLLTTTLFFALLWALEKPLLHLMGVDTDIFRVFSFVLFFDTLLVVPYAYLRVTHRPGRFLFYKLLNSGIFALGNLVFLLWFVRWWGGGDAMRWYLSHPKVYYIFLSNFIASGLTFLAFLPVLRHIRPGIDFGLWKRMFRYGYPVMIAGVLYIINENFDKLALERLAGKEVMGAYSAVYKLGVFMVLFTTAFRLGAEPFFFTRSKHKDARKNYAVIMSAFTAVAGLLLLGVMTFLQPVVGLLIHNRAYWKALPIVPVILTAYLFFGIYYNLSAWYKLTDRTHLGAWLSLLGAVITVAGNVWGIPRYGMMASAWATLGAYGSMSLLSFLLGRRYYPVPYATAKIGLYVLVAAGGGFAMFHLFYHQWGIRLVILILYLLLIWRSEPELRALVYSKLKR